MQPETIPRRPMTTKPMLISRVTVTIGIQGGAVRAKRLAVMLFAAVEADHQRDCLLFPLSLGYYVHQLSLPRSTE